MQGLNTVKSLYWLVHKDLTCELRARHVWPGMILLGLILVFTLASQLNLPASQKTQVVGGLLWLAIFFAGNLACERSLANERDAGCWKSLALYPLAPSVLFAAKVALNFIALGILELVLVPAFIVLSDVPLAARPGPLLLIAALGNLGFAAVGTIVSGLTSCLSHRGSLLALLVIPLVVPGVFGSAEATRLLLEGRLNSQWWLWIQLLAVFAAVYTILGALVFEFVLED